MAVIEVIRRRAVTLSIQRPVAAVITDGFAVPGTPQVVTVRGYHQPLSPREVRNLPPGQDASDWRNIWSEDEVLIRDRVTLGAEVFTVERVERWPEGPHWKSQAVIVKDQA